MDTRLYPIGSGGIKSRYVNGVLVFYNSSGTEIYRIDPTNSVSPVIMPGMVKQIRTRFTIAQVNAGATLLAAVAGFKYRMIDAYAIAIGGNAAAVTSVDLLATQAAASAKLVSFLVAGLTRSTLLRAGAATNGVILADGASFIQNDVATAITILKAGADVTTATHIDIGFTYALEG